jgi:hypothetical protein
VSIHWPIDRVTDPLPDMPDPVTPEWIRAALERNGAETMATAIIHYLSGRQFGYETVTVRPCPSGVRTRARDSDATVTSYLVSWEGYGWVGVPCGCGPRCTVSGPRVVHLPGPASEVTSVVVAGVELPEVGYRLEGNALYRIGGNWPGQDMGKPLGEANTWAVTYLRGRPVPAGVGALTGLLAKEIETALHDDGECRLPRTVTTASRQGVTYRAYDPAVIYKSGKTGLPEVDLWLASVNPNALMAAPSVR